MLKKSIFACSALALSLQSATVLAQEEGEDLGSRYLQCDGNPNNMTGGETFARLVGIVSLVGLFAPPPESPDPSKRQFGEAGVEVCSQLIDDPDEGEGNPVRRIPLILARAIHRIEAEDYAAAIIDVGLARQEASEAGLVGNPYFDRSMGMAFNRLESIANLRLGNIDFARSAAVEGARALDFHTYSMLLIFDTDVYHNEMSEEENRQMAALARLAPTYSMNYSLRLDDIGRFAEAAKTRRDWLIFLEAMRPGDVHSTHYARAALSEALAGEWENAQGNYTLAKDLIASKAAAGNPETDIASTIELIDLIDILRLINEGDLATARRNFAARSRWVVASLGAVGHISQILREGASSEELFGALEKTPRENWDERRDTRRAADVVSDKGNDRLFQMIPSYANIEAYESQSREVYRTERSHMIAEEPYLEDTEFYHIRSTTPHPIRNTVIMLHAALVAQEREKDGFMILTFSPLANGEGIVRFLDEGELGTDNHLFISAEKVVSELEQLIPPREVIRERRRRRRNRDKS